MSIPRDLTAAHPGIGEWSILHAYRGSIAHGMYVPQSNPDSIDDKDTMAFCVPPLDHYFGLAEFGSRGTQEIKRGEWDIVVYEARKAIRLLAQGNPNVLSMLWLPENMVISTTDAGRHLVEHRDLFVGRHAYKAFVGYAVAPPSILRICAPRRPRAAGDQGRRVAAGAREVTSSDPTPEQIGDGFALWQEHRPQTGIDWVRVAERFIADNGTTEQSSAIFLSPPPGWVGEDFDATTRLDEGELARQALGIDLELLHPEDQTAGGPF